MNREKYKSGAIKSPTDLRTFKSNAKASLPALARYVISAGTRWLKKFILDQHRVGICTSISTVGLANKVLGNKFSPDFQYLMQKREHDNKVYPNSPKDFEGSSLFAALKIANNIGFLPKRYMTPWITDEDRKLPYARYMAKLNKIPDAEIERFKKIASKYRIAGYASVKPTRDDMAAAIARSHSGILARFSIGKEWWTPIIEPLRKALEVISGHAVVISRVDGGSFRVENSWGTDWADEGSAYFLSSTYMPTEAWEVFFEEVPDDIEAQKKKLESTIRVLIQKLIDELRKILVTKIK